MGLDIPPLHFAGRVSWPTYVLATPGGDVHVVRRKFVWHVVTKVGVRDRFSLEASLKKSQYVSTEEIAAALSEVVRSAYSIKKDEAVSAAFAMLGFQRVTDSAQKLAHRALQLVSPHVKFDEQNDLLTWD